jgi:uncharacterized Zn-finger protein
MCCRKRKHLNHFPHKCAQCPKKFFTRQELDAHIRTHTGEKPFVCQKCNKSFARIHHLRRHMDTVHSDKDREKSTASASIKEEVLEKTETHIEVKWIFLCFSPQLINLAGVRGWTNQGGETND